MPVSFTDESPQAAVIAVNRKMINSLPSDDQIDHIFSKKFERNRQELISQYGSKARPKSRVWRKRWVAVLAAVIMALTVTMSVSALRETVFHFVTQVYEKYTQIFFSQTSSLPQSSTVFTAIKPGSIPDGFQLVHSETNGLLRLEYEKEMT